MRWLDRSMRTCVAILVGIMFFMVTEKPYAATLPVVAEYIGKSSGPALFAPTDVVVAKDGSVYVVNTGLNQLLVFPAPMEKQAEGVNSIIRTLNQEPVIAPPCDQASLLQPEGMVMDKDGHLFVANTNGNSIVIYKDMICVGQAVLNNMPEEFALDRPKRLSIGSDPDGDGSRRLLITDQLQGGRVLFLDFLPATDGMVPQLEYAGSILGLRHPGGILATGKYQFLLANSYSQDSAYIRELKADQSLVREFGAKGTSLHNLLQPEDVVKDSKGNYWVANTGLARIEKYDSSGTLLAWFGPEGIGEVPLKSPRGLEFVIVEGKEFLLIADSDRNSLSMVELGKASEKGPVITHQPLTGYLTGTPEINATVTDADSGVASVNVLVKLMNGSSFTPFTMFPKEKVGEYRGKIFALENIASSITDGHGFPIPVEVEYYIEAVNQGGKTSQTPHFQFTYYNPPGDLGSVKTVDLMMNGSGLPPNTTQKINVLTKSVTHLVEPVGSGAWTSGAAFAGDTIHLAPALKLTDGFFAGTPQMAVFRPGAGAECMEDARPFKLPYQHWVSQGNGVVSFPRDYASISIKPGCKAREIKFDVALQTFFEASGEYRTTNTIFTLALDLVADIERLFVSRSVVHRFQAVRLYLVTPKKPASIQGRLRLQRAQDGGMVKAFFLKDFQVFNEAEKLYYLDYIPNEALMPGQYEVIPELAADMTPSTARTSFWMVGP